MTTARFDPYEVPLVTYEIPYHSDYIRMWNQTGEEIDPCEAHNKTDEVCGFKFHLSERALELIAEQGGFPNQGFQKLEILWNAMNGASAKILATQAAVRIWAPGLIGGAEPGAAKVDDDSRRIYIEAWEELVHKLTPIVAPKWMRENLFLFKSDGSS